ncbi:probable disease resistance protein At4g27220 isoform X2 [Dioscorea cayenensis subsp. rotundata]|uniref:Probable disease resistance protein At4g27220 isoform X2 n=1 Tax=Dioscorea cayennensis subsp. rotundata TaxID=55577 RepID=A0AB40CLE6_DIOCR|nr:probable disease resistance protein At4g27220 isoform X2 [Dioscorea cayenensis subsp. rotundata]
MDFVSTITGVIFDHAWDHVGRHIGYLLSYKRNINKLERKFDELDALRKDVQERVDATRRERLEVVDNVVQNWLMNVDRKEKEVKKIKENASANKHFLHIGLHYKLGKEAADLIKTTDDLIREGKFASVSHKQPPPSTTDSLLYNEGFVIFDSRKSRAKKILEALKNEAVHSIGLCGMGGVGKTMLVKDVAKQAKEQSFFGEVVMVTASQNIDLKKIQKEMAECLGFPLNEENVVVRAAKLAERLTTKKNKVLVILDDLWEQLHLSKVGIRFPEMATTCKVVITTRNKDVCKRMSCKEIVELNKLSDEESWSLFRSRAGDAVESPTMRELAWNVARECDGLPLALVVLGAALKGEKPEHWNTVLKQLKKSMDVDLLDVSKEVFQSIKLSFDILKNETAKSCFLHCCLYPEDYDIPKEELMHLMVGGDILIGVETLNDAQDRVNLLLDQLKARSLLLQGKDERFVKMHDVVRDVTIQIGAVADHAFYCRAGQGLKEWPVESEMRNCRRLSLMGNDIKDLRPDPMQYPKLEMLILRDNRRLSSIPEMFFQHMGSLMVLDLSYTDIKSLPNSLSCLTNLRALNLRGCRALEDISHINGLKMLEILILEDCPVSIAPEGVKWAQNVRFVDLGISVMNDYFSKEFPRFHRLEQLFMSKFAGSFRELILSLRHLTHLFIDQVVDLDDSLSHELVSPGSWPDRLQDFSINFLPEHVQYWYHLHLLGRRRLGLMGTNPLAVWVKKLLEKTQNLALAEFQETELSSIDCLLLSSLEYLTIVNWPNLIKLLGDERLLHEQMNLSQLKQMRIDNCPRLISLIPSSLWGSMQKLEYVRVKACPMMLELFPFECPPNLKKLHIDNCGVRYVVSSEMDTVAILADPSPALENLHIRNCQKMIGMISPSASLQTPCFLQRLEFLLINSCPRLTHLFSYKQAISMQHLSDLFIEDCAALEAVVISTENKEEASSSAHVADHESNSLFPNLINLVLDHLPQLTAFHHPTENLEIINCQKMIGMISPLASLQVPCFFQRLINLTVNSCPRLTHLFSYEQAISMQHLSDLSISKCAALEAVVISTENKEEASSSTHVADHESYNSPFPNLRRLMLRNLPQLTAFHHPTAPPVEWLHLERYVIRECPKLQEPLKEQIRALRARMNEGEDSEGEDSEEEDSDDL